MKIFNTLTLKKEELNPIDPDEVKIYNCGPTVYNYNHIGNFRSYIFVDTLRRYLKFRGYRLNHTSNITDIDDKIIQNAIKENKTIYEFTKEYTKAFLEDLETLNIEPVEHRPKATEHIPSMIELMQNLKKNNYVYEIDGNIYYKISNFSEYGKLAKIEKSQLMAGASQRFDVDEYTKEDVRDFALWKKPVLEKEPRWNSPFGEGRPGWHLECSAMIRSIYGKKGIDIHIGGVDLIFPHHENEIAQSKGAYPEDNFVKYWMHNEHLLVNGKKMSKSLGNFYTLRDLVTLEGAKKLVEKNRAPHWLIEYVEKKYIAKAIRFVLLSTHYRQKLNFTFDQIQSAHQILEKIQNTIIRVIQFLSEHEKKDWNLEEIAKEYQIRYSQDREPAGKKGAKLVEESSYSFKSLKNYIEAMDDDLNISLAISSLHDLIHIINSLLDEYEIKQNVSKLENITKELKNALIVLYAMNLVFAVFEFHLEKKEEISKELQAWIEEKIREREKYRKQKNFKKADEIRVELQKIGIQIVDMPSGTKWKKL